MEKLPATHYLTQRKLMRASLRDFRVRMTVESLKRKSVPQEQTNAETFFYSKQIQEKTLMVIRLQNGEELRGTIRWYDKNCVMLCRETEPNLLVFKHCILWMHKGEGRKVQS